MKTLKLDARAKEMAKEALEFAMVNRIGLSYVESFEGFYFYFPKTMSVSHGACYLTWQDREERFTKIMQEAKELI